MTAVRSMTVRLAVTPVPKPRQTRADKWKKRPNVLAYRAFADELRLRWAQTRLRSLEGARITFWLPMPASWPKYKQEQSEGQLHRQRPDLDNLLKSVLDALYGEDSHIARLEGLEKRWGREGCIEITQEVSVKDQIEKHGSG